MKIEEITELMEAMRKNGLSMLEWENEGSRIRLKRPAAKKAKGASGQNVAGADESADLPGGSSADDAVDGDLVTAPVVGIFYAAPSPDSDPFVRTGSTVEAGSTLCIIEAMKLMNEVTSSKAGKVLEILVEDGQKVEFGQPLMRIGGGEDAV